MTLERPDQVTPFDLAAYVDDQLDARRRVEVEDHLSRNPQAAAEVMADLRTRDALRLSFPRPDAAPSEQLLAAALRLERGLGRARVLERLRRIAALALLVGAGWVAHAEIGPLNIGRSVASPVTPAFLDDVTRAHQAALARASLAPTAETQFDAVALEAAADVPVPSLPEAWRVRDVQVVPAHGGPGLELTAEGGGLGLVTLFGERVPGFGLVEPTLIEVEGQPSVYWQIGETAYALTGRAAPAALQQAARDLSRTTH